MIKFKLRPIEAAAASLAAIEAALAFHVSRHGVTAPIAVHFGLSGRPDRWAGREALTAGVAVQAAVGLLAVAALGFAARRAEAGETRRRGLAVAQALVAGLVALLAAFQLSRGLGWAAPPASVLVGGLSLLIGAVLGRVPPNALVGVRTPWSLSSRRAWDRSNRLAGRLLAATGLLGLAAAALAPEAVVMPLVLSGMLLSSVAAAAESWRVWRTDPERLLI